MPRIAAPARRRGRRFTLWLVGRLLYYFPRCGFVEPAMSRAYRGLCVVVLLAIGVNSFLWRASLDTLAFMPLASADPFGGVIITDWYSPPETPDERFKVNVFILDRQLRSDGVRAAVFHQHHDANGAWTDASVEATTQLDLENAILTRARQLRVNTALK